MGVPEPPGRGAADERVLRLVDEARQRGAEDRHVDPLTAPGDRAPVALATDERRQDPDRPEHPGHHVADGHARPWSARRRRRPAAPVIDISPLVAWMMKS